MYADLLLVGLVIVAIGVVLAGLPFVGGVVFVASLFSRAALLRTLDPRREAEPTRVGWRWGIVVAALAAIAFAAIPFVAFSTN
jgi:hypothetical protein